MSITFPQVINLQELASLQNLQAGLTNWTYMLPNGECGEAAVPSFFTNQIETENTTNYKVSQGTCASKGFTTFVKLGKMAPPVAAYSNDYFNYKIYSKGSLQLQNLQAAITDWTYMLPNGNCGEA